MLQKIDALSAYYVYILEHILLLLLKQISRENKFKEKKRLLVTINKPANSVPVNESNQSGSLATNVFIKALISYEVIVKDDE